MTRLRQLDALRGIMALIVVVQHMYLSFPENFAGGLLAVIKYSPLRIFIGGHAAVLVFFVMSGFVLALPFVGGRKLIARDFLVRRFARLYPPYAFSILVAAILFALVGGNPPLSVSSWLHENWKDDLSPMLVLMHLLGGGRAQDISLNSPIWSLILELRVALLFPMLCFLTLRIRWPMVFMGCVLLFAANKILPAIGEAQDIYVSAATWYGSLLLTARYLIFFIIGIVLADTMTSWRPMLDRFSSGRRFTTLLIALALLCAPSTYNEISDWIIGIGATVVIAITVAWGEQSRMLMSRPVHWLGRVSFSLYLIHMPIWLACAYLLADRIGLVATTLLFIVILVPAAEAVYRLVEKPSIDLGRRLVRTPAAVGAPAQ